MYMDTKAWGPDAWITLHQTIERYDELDKAKLVNFFTLLPYILPCVFCRNSLHRFYTQDPIQMDSRSNARAWLYSIHNMVNKKLSDQGHGVARAPPLSSIHAIHGNPSPDCGRIFIGSLLYCEALQRTRISYVIEAIELLFYLHPHPITRERTTKYLKSTPIPRNTEALKIWFNGSPLRYRSREEMSRECRSYRAKCSKGTCRAD